MCIYIYIKYTVYYPIKRHTHPYSTDPMRPVAVPSRPPPWLPTSAGPRTWQSEAAAVWAASGTNCWPPEKKHQLELEIHGTSLNSRRMLDVFGIQLCFFMQILEFRFTFHWEVCQLRPRTFAADVRSIRGVFDTHPHPKPISTWLWTRPWRSTGPRKARLAPPQPACRPAFEAPAWATARACTCGVGRTLCEACDAWDSGSGSHAMKRSGKQVGTKPNGL